MSIPTRITFSHLSRVIKNAGIKNNVPLGRWGIRNETNRGLVVDYFEVYNLVEPNEDHCGNCGDYIQMKQTTQVNHFNSTQVNHFNSTQVNHFNSTIDNDYNHCLELEYISMTCNLPN